MEKQNLNILLRNLMLSRIQLNEDVGKREPLGIVGGIVHWFHQYGRQCGASSNNGNII